MQAIKKEASSRCPSLFVTALTEDEKKFENVDVKKLYECVLKIVILDYSNEARFRTPLKDTSNIMRPVDMGNNIPRSRMSKYIQGADEPKLSVQIIDKLEASLNSIALKKTGKMYDELTRRSLLRMYSEVLDPTFRSDLQVNLKPEYLVMKFVSCANKEIVKIGNVPSNEVSAVVFKHANSFVNLLVENIGNEKGNEALKSKLMEFKESLNPGAKNKSQNPSNSTVPESGRSFKYAKPSYRISDMDQSHIQLLLQIFPVDEIKLQQDVMRYKNVATQACLQKDIEQVIFYIEKDLGISCRQDFAQPEIYDAWKKYQLEMCTLMKNKYSKIDDRSGFTEAPPSGYDYYILPSTRYVKIYFTIFLKLYLESVLLNIDTEINFNNLFSKQALSLINLCARLWGLDSCAQFNAYYTACNLTEILKTSKVKDKNPNSLSPINPESYRNLMNLCYDLLNESNFIEFRDMPNWPLKEKEQFTRNLTDSYNQIMLGIKHLLGSIFSRDNKPKFGPYISLLQDFIETNQFFTSLEKAGLPKKWEKRLSKSLLHTSEKRYADLLGLLPRDDRLNLSHIVEISEQIVEDIKLLQRRYQAPLLGFLNVVNVAAVLMTSMFAVDSQNVLKHIVTYARNKGQVLPYNDLLDVYRSLNEIRSVFYQSSTRKTKFPFILEEFFYPHLESWVKESEERIVKIASDSVSYDKLEPIDLEDDTKKYSSSVLDFFTLIREYLKIINGLQWRNDLQLAKSYTSILKGISDGAIVYSNIMSENISSSLEEEENEKMMNNLTVDNEKSKAGNWFDDVKQAVSSIQGNGSRDKDGTLHDFKPSMCVALNNLSAMLQKLNKLEEIVDPEEVSNCLEKHDESSKFKFLSHIFSIRILRAEDLKSTSSSVNPYITIIDSNARKSIWQTRTLTNTLNPEWDEEFEVVIPPNSSLPISFTIWDKRRGTQSICGRAILQLDPKRYKHDGIVHESYLDLDTQGRILLEVSVEHERRDAIFIMGRAHRFVQTTQDRCIKLIVERFSRFVHSCISKANLRSISGGNYNVRPSQEQIDGALIPLLNYLNLNLQVLAEYLSNDLLIKVMVATWSVVLSSADDILLPKLISAKNISSTQYSGSRSSNGGGWQTAVTSAVANVSSSIGIGQSIALTHNEVEIVLTWLHFLCFDFFHNDGNGPPLADLKNEQYQSLLLIPVYFDRDVSFLCSEVERLAPAFEGLLKEKNDLKNCNSLTVLSMSGIAPQRSFSRYTSITANATKKMRQRVINQLQKERTDPLAVQVATEDIILRVLLARGENAFVSRRLEQREKMARIIATESLARAAVNGSSLYRN